MGRRTTYFTSFAVGEHSTVNIFMSTFAQNFVPEDAGYWRWMIERPLMRDARAKFDLSVYGCWEEEDEDDPTIEVAVSSPGSDTVLECHEIAWNYLVDNRELIEGILRAELLKHHKLGWTAFQRDIGDDTDGWEDIRDRVDWDAESAIDHLYALQSITLGPEASSDCAVATFHFASSWDTEHGVEISLWRDKLVE